MKRTGKILIIALMLLLFKGQDSFAQATVPGGIPLRNRCKRRNPEMQIRPGVRKLRPKSENRPERPALIIPIVPLSR